MASREHIAPEVVTEWLTRLRASESLLEQEHLPTWQKVLEEYAGRPPAASGLFGVQGAEDFEPINYLLSTANAILPSVIAGDPYLRVRPRRPQDQDGARTAQYALNWVWDCIGATQTTRQIALDGLLFGVGFGKVGFDPAGTAWTEKEYDQGPEVSPPQDRAVEDPDARLLREALAEQGIYTTDEPQDKPTLTRVAPWDVLLPPGYNNLEDCPWVAERLVARLEDLRSDPRFRIPKEAVADAYLDREVPRSYLQGDQNNAWVDPGFEPEYTVIYEIRYWRRTRGGGMRRYILWLLRDPGTGDVKDSVIRHVKDPMQMHGYPYVPIRFVRSPQDFYATQIADLAAVRPLAHQLNDLWDNILGLQRLNHQIRGKYLAAAGALEDGSLSQLLNSPRRGAVQEVNVPGLDIRAAFMPLPEATQPADTPLVLTQLQRMLHEVSGVDVYQRGGVGRKGTTATEVRTAHQGFMGRASLRRESIERFCEGIASKMLSVMRQFWDESRWVRVVGDSGEEEFIEFSAADIQGVYDVTIDAGSMEPTDPADEQVAHQGLLQTIGATVEVLVPLVQSGMLPPDSIANFIDRAFVIYQQDRRSLVGPLAALQSAASQAFAPSTPSSTPQGPSGAQGEVQGQGFDPATGGGLAGTGPRPGPGGMPS